jgi:hypothetical protein
MTTVNRFAAMGSWAFAFGMCAALAIGCGGAAPPPATPPPAPEATAAPTPAPSATAPTNSEASAVPGEPPQEPPADSPTPAATPPGGKNIVYRMTASGLVIELDGVQLEPHAAPIKLGGGWGVKLSVRAKATDDREHRLQSPTQGPLMVAAEIDRGGKKELVPDQREGDGEITLAKSPATAIEREVRKPIVAGQSLTLYVGLWGLGADAGDRKPIKKLFVVRMVAGTHKPQPVVTAPE